MIVSTVERARGRWLEILPRLGVEHRFLVNRHGPCPICGGKDRFRFDDKDGEGTWFCNRCRAGTGIILVRMLNGWSHKQACDAVDEVIGTDYRPALPRKAGNDDRRREAALKRLLASPHDDSVVSSYLRGRGLAVSSPALIGVRSLAYYAGRDHVGNYPTVVAPIAAPTGKVISAHRIYVTDAIPKADRKKFMALASGDTLNGATVRLFDVDEEMGVAEGVETALAANQLFGVPVWPVLNANGIRTFKPPATVRRVHIFGDNDESGTGQAAAWHLAALLRRDGIEAPVNIPASTDSDWLDVLVGKAIA